MAKGERSDLISRQEALRTDCFGDGHDGLRAFHMYEDYKKMRDYIEALPSVQPDGIPLEWIDKHLEWLDNCDNEFAQLAKVSIRAMVELWKKDRI